MPSAICILSSNPCKRKSDLHEPVTDVILHQVVGQQCSLIRNQVGNHMYSVGRAEKSNI